MIGGKWRCEGEPQEKVLKFLLFGMLENNSFSNKMEIIIIHQYIEKEKLPPTYCKHVRDKFSFSCHVLQFDEVHVSCSFVSTFMFACLR